MNLSIYHKSQSQWDRLKVVPRFLPWRVGQLMAVYLAYVQPLKEFLTVQVLGGGWSDYVWADARGSWKTDRLTRVVCRETEARLGNRLTTHDYRHAAVGIGRVVVGGSFARGYQDEVGEGVEEEEEVETEESPVELQSGRTTAIGMIHYRVPADIVKHLSIRSLEVFRPLSERWHSFLGLRSGGGGSSKIEKGVEEGKVGETALSWPRGGLPQKRRRHGLELGAEAAAAGAQRRKRTGQVDGRELQAALRQALGKPEGEHVSFRSAERERAVHAVLQGQTPLVVVLPTGGGKSFLFMVPACLEGEDDPGVTVVVVPFRALVEDILHRLREAGIGCLEWTPGETEVAAVVVVSADFAASWGFLSYASPLVGRGLIRRLFIDECYLTFTASDWRPKLAKLKDLRVLGCPIVLLTATLPPVLEEELAECMLVRCATCIRASTVRPNIRYTVQWCLKERGRDVLTETALAICRRQQRRLAEGGGGGSLKGIVYCCSKAQCEEIAADLGCAYYHADRLDAWLQRGGFIVATSALGTGVDFRGIVFVLHVGMPWGMIDFAQESGRAGRDGEPVDSIVLVEEGELGRRAERQPIGLKLFHSDLPTWPMPLFYAQLGVWQPRALLDVGLSGARPVGLAFIGGFLLQ